MIVGASVVFSLICAPASAESFTDGECTVTDYTSFSAQEYALSYLRMLGIADGIDPAANVTRGQVVSAIVRALGGESAAISLSGSMYTYDEKMAAYAHGCGILSGSTPSEWQLDSPVTGAQLSKMLVVTLGYGAIITSPNAYPAEYLGYAVKTGLTKGVADIGSDTVSGGDFAIMLMNALEADILEVVGVTDDEAIYEISDDATLESIYLQKKKLVKAEGIVEADFYTSIVADARCEFSRIRIDGILYTCQSENLKGLVGSKIEFVYADEKSEAKRVIVGTRLTEENTIYEFSSGHNAYYTDGELRYESAGDKEDKILLASNAVYVVNNKLLSSYDLKNVDFGQYVIKAIDNNDDSRCDVVFLTRSESMIVNYVKDDIIYLSYGTLNSKNVIDLSDYKADTDALIIRDVSGTPKALSDIAENSSISVIASDDLGFVEIIILTEPIYAMNFANLIMGDEPETINAQAKLWRGVDVNTGILMKYPNGSLAVVECSLEVFKPRSAYVYGTKGYMHIPNFYGAQELYIKMADEDEKHLSLPRLGDGFEEEIYEASLCIMSGKRQSDIHPMSDSIKVLRQMDTVRKQIGVAYPLDGEEQI